MISNLTRLNNVQPKQVVVYYTGTCIAKDFLASEIKLRAYEMWINDEVFLVQRKLHGESPPMFEYIAIGKESPPDIKEVSKRKNYTDKISWYKN